MGNMETKLLYLEKMDQLTGEATVLDVIEENGKQVVILDQTVFYPQGGGQPYDIGEIASGNATLKVEQVRYFEGTVKHIGTFEKGTFQKDDKVTCHVNPERRLLNARLHSAGHMVDMAVYSLKPEWVPTKRYHFPDGPYVEYSGAIDETEKEALKQKLEELGNKTISEGGDTKVLFIEKSEMSKYCRHVPENIPEGKPTRIVLFGDFGVPCGGTHVQNLSELKHLTIRKIKQEGSNIRVGYDVSR